RVANNDDLAISRAVTIRMLLGGVECSHSDVAAIGPIIAVTAEVKTLEQFVMRKLRPCPDSDISRQQANRHMRQRGQFIEQLHDPREYFSSGAWQDLF